MPAPSDILQFFRGQLFQTPGLPDTDFGGKTVVVTGGNSGLGLECVKHLVRLNASTVIIGCRDTSKGEAAKKEVVQAEGNNTTIHVWEVDLASFDSVKSFCQRIDRELPRLDALVANAGISVNEYRVAEGFEQTLTVNVISTFLMSILCLPLLERTSSQTGTPTHLAITGSNVHSFADHKQLQQPSQGEIFRTLSDKSQADMAARYFLSKLIVMLCVREMAETIFRKSSGKTPKVILNCPSPGWCKTPLFRQDDGGFFGRNLLRLIGRTAEVGSRTLPSAIAAGSETHGHYLSECQVKSESVWVRSKEGQVMQKRIWDELVDIVRNVSPSAVEILQ